MHKNKFMKKTIYFLFMLCAIKSHSQLLKGSNYFSLNALIGEFRSESNYLEAYEFEKIETVDTTGSVKTSSNSNLKISGAFGYHIMLNQKWQLNLKSHIATSSTSNYKRYDLGLGIRHYFAIDSMSLYRQFFVELNGFNGNMEFGANNNFYNQIGILGGMTWRVGVTPFTDYKNMDKMQRIIGHFGIELQFGASARFSELYSKPDVFPVINVGLCYYLDRKHWFNPIKLKHVGLEKAYSKDPSSVENYQGKRKERNKQISIQKQSLSR